MLTKTSGINSDDDADDDNKNRKTILDTLNKNKTRQDIEEVLK